jgi:peptidoglycan/LPS O-acetylase OafA/YrhL
MKISKYWKAVVAAIAAGAGAVTTAAQDGQITGEEWWTAAVAVLAALGLTWAVPNKPSTGEDTQA